MIYNYNINMIQSIYKKKIILKILFIISITFLLCWKIYALDKMEYKNLWIEVLEKWYNEYKKEKETIIEENFKNIDNNIVKIKTVFDINQEEFEKEVRKNRIELLSKISRKEKTSSWNNNIDNIINTLEKPWKYIVIDLEWEVFLLNNNTALFLPKYNLLWKKELISRIKRMINNRQSSKNANYNDIFTLLDRYDIKYHEIPLNGNTNNIYIWRQRYEKQSWKEIFFLNINFTTPFLSETIEKKDWDNKSSQLYLWTYISNEDFIKKYNADTIQRDDWKKIKTELDWNQIYIDLFWKKEYIGEYKKEEKILQNTLYKSSKDLYIYNIKKNKYEYFILLAVFLLGVIFWNYLLFNFINNFKNNFKKTPEEI